MPDTPTPAPALTAEQIDNMAGTFCDAYLRTLPPFGHPVGKDLFRRWYAAVIARAKREAAEEIAASIAARLTGDKHGCLRYGVDCPACRALDRAIDYVKEAAQ